MDYVDYSYILRLGSSLELFSEIRRGLFRSRCPICGDSKRRKNLARFFIFDTGDSKPRAYCHNCGFSSNLPFLLKSLNPGLFSEYRLEKFSNKILDKKEQIDYKLKSDTSKKPEDHKKSTEIYQLPSCLPSNEIQSSKDFMDLRKIPDHIRPYLIFYY